jgi:type II secretory pathway pseudopilin PulG
MRSRRLRVHASASQARHSASGFDDQGYILVALLVGIAIASIWMTAALPSWRQQAIREKEAELIFRGEQYARAILLYQQKMNGALPTNLDDLVSQHVLRRKWKDPIANAEFLPKVGCMAAGPGGQPGVGAPGLPGRGGTPTIPGRGTTPIGPPVTRPGGRVGLVDFANPVVQQQMPTRGMPMPPQMPPQTPGAPGRPQVPGQMPGQFPGGQPGQGGICGVQSTSKAASIKIYNGQQQYDLWQFDIQTAQQRFALNVNKLGGGGGAPGQGMAPTMPGRGVPTGPRGAQPPGGRGPIFPGGGPGGGPGRGIPPGGAMPPQPPAMPPGFPGGRGRGL